MKPLRVKSKGKLQKKDKKDKNACERERGERKREKIDEEGWRKKKHLKIVGSNDERKN